MFTDFGFEQIHVEPVSILIGGAIRYKMNRCCFRIFLSRFFQNGVQMGPDSMSLMFYIFRHCGKAEDSFLSSYIVCGIPNTGMDRELFFRCAEMK